MAIDRAAVQLWREIKSFIPSRPTVLEVGQANWFGDVPWEEAEELRGIVGLEEMNFFEVARHYYARILDYAVLDSIDGNGSDPQVWALDLNEPLLLENERYDIVINTGTTEHVFDQRQVFKTIHDVCRPNGLMVHAFPTAGCIDHGFYTYSPSLLHGLALVNGYKTLAALRTEMDGDQIMHLAWKKGPNTTAFRVPYQHGYAKAMGGGLR